MSKLSDRLAEAKTELGISTRRMVEEAAKGGYSLSNHSASVYTNGKHPERPDPRTLEALSYVLRVPLSEVRELASLPSETEPFQAHASADLLTPPQRTAVNEIIRLLADANRKAGADDGTPMRPAGNFGTRHAPGDLDTDYATDADILRMAAHKGPNRGRDARDDSPAPHKDES